MRDMYQPDSLWPSKVRVNPTVVQIPGGEFCTENAGLSKISWYADCTRPAGRAGSRGGCTPDGSGRSLHKAKPTVMGGHQVCNQACRPCNDGGVTVTTQKVFSLFCAKSQFLARN